MVAIYGNTRGGGGILPIFLSTTGFNSFYTTLNALTRFDMCPGKKKNKGDESNDEVERLRERHAAVERENEILEEEIRRGERDAAAYRRNMDLLREYWQARGGQTPPPPEEEEEDDRGRDDTKRAGEEEEKRA